eukprot:COSAG01_NODE_577_length_15268_cov_31.213462_2_plen_77_part_00
MEGGELVCSCGGVASGAAVPASAPTGLLSASRRKSELLKSRWPTRDLGESDDEEVGATGAVVADEKEKKRADDSVR